MTSSEKIDITIPKQQTELRTYTGDLTPLQKSQLMAEFEDANKNTLGITFAQHPSIYLTIRRQDIFDSNAQVIVNAANTHLGGGGGIDGAIHREGGKEYANAHRQLQAYYQSQYVEGYAAMIDSGQLKKKKNIENVIVVAGPQGETSPEKETQLYSCYFNALVLAHQQGKTSIAFPSISTGIFAFPKDRAAAISMKAIYDFIEEYDPETPLKTISIHFSPNNDPAKNTNNLEIYRDHIYAKGE